VPSARDLLQRFRPAGAPGPAAATGVPADRVAERAVELGPLFARLQDTTGAVARIRADAAAEADRRRQQARERASARVAEARLEADAIRAAALAEAQRGAASAARTSAEQAAARAASITRRSREVLDDDVAEVVRRVRAALVTLTGQGSP
jgi:vacuolar-type H+-ATPase subunit H